MKIYIKTTESCNLRCKHCYIGNNRNKCDCFNEDKTIKYLENYIKCFNMKKDSLQISFHGGEPFLCDLDKMQKVCDAFPEAEFDATSNLLLLNNNIIDFIKKNFKFNNKPFIKTSWDYDIRFRSKDEEELWENNVLTLIQNGISVKINICLTKQLINKISPQQLVDYLSKLKPHSIHFERLTSNTTEDKSLIPSYEDIDNWLCNLYKLNSNIVVDNFEELKLAINGIHIDCRKRECMSNTLTINADGTIGGCPNTSISNSFTNINDDPKESINHKLCNLISKENIRHTECYYCEFYKICNGDCHQLDWQGEICPAPKRLIKAIKNDMEK